MTNRAPDVGSAPALAGKLLDLVVEHPGGADRAPPAGVPHPRHVRRAPGRARRGRRPRLHARPPGRRAGSSRSPAPRSTTPSPPCSRRIDGVNTHTFFSYRVAETLARYGPFADNRLIAGWDQAPRGQPGRGLRLVRPGSRCSTRGCPATTRRCCRAARSVASALGLTVDDAAVDGAGRPGPRPCSAANPRHYLDDSTHGIGRYDIYAADVWLFTEPLADRLGPAVGRGAGARRSALVEAVGSPDGTAVGWGRSTGVLGRRADHRAGRAGHRRWPHRPPGPLAAPGRRRDRRPGPVVPRRAHRRPPAPVDLRVPRAVPAAADDPRHPRASWPGPRPSWPTSTPLSSRPATAEAYPWQDQLSASTTPGRPRCGPIAARAPSWWSRSSARPAATTCPPRTCAACARCRSTRGWSAGCRW